MAATVLRIAADRIVSDSEVELGEVLGYGAYGVASRGRIRGEDVCIKQYHVTESLDIYGVTPGSEAHFAALAELKTEANVLARLHDEHIVSFRYVVYNHKTGSPRFLAMELASCNLRMYLSTLGRHLSVTGLVNIALPVAKGLKYLHGQVPPVVHRDLKLENVLVFRLDGEQTRVKLGDLGVAKKLDPTATTTARGAPLYQAPEVSQGPFTPYADVFSFGIMLAEVVATYVLESAPRDADHVTVPLRDVWIKESVEYLSQSWPMLSKLIAKCCDKEPARRLTSSDIVIWLESVMHPRDTAELPHFTDVDEGGSRASPVKSSPASGLLLYGDSPTRSDPFTLSPHSMTQRQQLEASRGSIMAALPVLGLEAFAHKLQSALLTTVPTKLSASVVELSQCCRDCGMAETSVFALQQYLWDPLQRSKADENYVNRLKDVITRQEEELEACTRALRAGTGTSTADGAISYRAVGQLSVERDVARQEAAQWEERHARLAEKLAAATEQVQRLQLRVDALNDPGVCRALLRQCEDEVVAIWQRGVRLRRKSPGTWWSRWFGGRTHDAAGTTRAPEFVDAQERLVRARTATQHVECSMIGSVVRRVPVPFEGISGISVNRDASLIALCGESHDGALVAVFRLPHSEQVGVFHGGALHPFQPVRLCFADNDTKLIVADSAGNCVLHLSTALVELDLFRTSSPFAVAASDANRLFVVGSRCASQIKLFSTASPATPLTTFETALDDCVGATFHHSGRFLACIDTRANVAVYAVQAVGPTVDFVSRFSAFCLNGSPHMCDVVFTNAGSLVCSHLASSQLSVFEPIDDVGGEATSLSYACKHVLGKDSAAHRPISLSSRGCYVFIGEYLDKSVVVVM